MDGSNIQTKYPVVLRFEGLYPHHLAGYEAHRLRKGGDLGHVDRSRTKLNAPPLIGGADWAAEALAEIKDMTGENFAAELEALEKRKRRKDLQRRMVEGPKQPWRPTRHGPMREVILTVNKDWFAGDLGSFFGEGENQREKEFGQLAMSWLKENFGNDVIHARADQDEAAYHIHAVIMPRATVEIAKPKAKMEVATATRRMLQPSIHPLIKDYEAAQDSVGSWFADPGLVRGEERAKAIREAREKKETPPHRRRHAKTWQWRAAEEHRLAAEQKALVAREARVEEREAEAETVLAVADGLAAGTFTVETTESGPDLIQALQVRAAEPTLPLERLRAQSPKGFARAVGLFGQAWVHLFGAARDSAEAAADARVATAMEEIGKADEKIVQIALRLPVKERTIIAKIRRAIPAILSRLEQRFGESSSIPREPKEGRHGQDQVE